MLVKKALFFVLAFLKINGFYVNKSYQPSITTEIQQNITKILENVDLIVCWNLDEENIWDFDKFCFDTFKEKIFMIYRINFWSVKKTKSFKFDSNSGIVINVKWKFLQQNFTSLIKYNSKYFLVVQDVPTSSMIEHFLKNIWKHLELFNIYLINNNTVYFYNPFQLNPVTYKHGKILNSNFPSNIPTDFQKYPIRMGFFKSTLANPIYSKQNSSVIEAFQGVDHEIAIMLSWWLNFEGILRVFRCI